MNDDKTRRPTPRRKLRRRSRHNASEVGFVDLPPRDAAPRLGFPTVDALWAYLRRHEAEPGRVDLGAGAYAYRRGRRAWVIRIPRT